MRPIEFPEKNFTFTKPADMTDEECSSLHVHRNAQGSWSCWQPDDLERKLIAEGKPIWLLIVGRGHPPVLVTAHKPAFPEQIEGHTFSLIVTPDGKASCEVCKSVFQIDEKGFMTVVSGKAKCPGK